MYKYPGSHFEFSSPNAVQRRRQEEAGANEEKGKEAGGRASGSRVSISHTP